MERRFDGKVTAMVHGVAERAGRLDYVVCNAGINPTLTWDNTSVEDFNRLFETNVRGTWVVATEAAKQMIREGHGGAICFVSSISAHVGAPYQTAYCGTKGAISMLAKALACNLGEHGIRVNAVEPGVDDNPDEQTDPGRPGGREVLRGADPAAPRRARGTRGRDHLPAVWRCQLCDRCDSARGRGLHRERRDLGARR